MIRMKAYYMLALLIVPLALACGGSGGGDTLQHAMASMREGDLAMMTPALDELGDGLAGLKMDPDSGATDNEDAAATSIDPDDTADDLAQMGRLGGYHQTYIDPDYTALDAGRGVLSVSMELDLFQDDAGAGRFFTKQRDDFSRLEGEALDSGILIKRTESFPVPPLADEAAGLHVRAYHDKTEVYQTVVAFRMGRLVAAALLLRADDADVGSQVQEMASALADRIEEVLLDSAAVSRSDERTDEPSGPQRLGGTADAELVGEWRIYSETLFLDAGGGGGTDSRASVSRALTLSDDGTWEFGPSGGDWHVTSIDSSDWDSWGTAPYGPERKIVLEGWNDGVGEGPIEESENGVNFLWVIYRVDDPEPGTVQMKFGHR